MRIIRKLLDYVRVTAHGLVPGLAHDASPATRRSQIPSSQQQKRFGARLGAIKGSCDLAHAVEEKLGRERAQTSDNRGLVQDLSASRIRLRYRDG